MPPFRWDLVTPDQLGSLLDGTEPPTLWFLDDLVTCAGKVLARSGNGRLVFVGRSLDSMFDLFGGAVPDRVARLPFSFAGQVTLSPEEVRRAREVLTSLDLTPAALARRPVTFVDVVYRGSTFAELFTLLDDWIDETREPWDVIRRQLRFVGVTIQGKTSPNTWRWQQHAEWTSRLPARSVVNVSLPLPVWHYLGNAQTKLTRQFNPAKWLTEDDGPQRDERRRQALAEAIALVAYGRSKEGRRAIARATTGEPALQESWLRTLINDLQLHPGHARVARSAPASRAFSTRESRVQHP